MSEREFETYLNLLARFLKLSPEQRRAIEKELRAHLEERLDELTEKGYSRDDAIEAALAEFGDAAGLADDFAKATRGPRIRRRIMQTGIGTLAAAAAIALTFTFLLPENRQGVPERPRSFAADPEAKTTAGAFTGGEPVAAERLPVLTQLQEPITLNLQDGTIEELFDALQEQTGVPFRVRWSERDDAGAAQPSFPFSYQVTDVSALDVLRMLQKELASLGEFHPHMVIQPEEVVVQPVRGARAYVDIPMLTCLYDIRDLLKDDGHSRDRSQALVDYVNLATIRAGEQERRRFFPTYDGLMAARVPGGAHQDVEDALALLREALATEQPAEDPAEVFTEQAIESGLLVTGRDHGLDALHEPVSIDVTDAPLYQVFAEIRNQTGARLAVEWRNDHFNPQDRATLDLTDVPAIEAIDALTNALDVKLRLRTGRYVTVSADAVEPGSKPAIEIHEAAIVRFYDAADLLDGARPGSEEAHKLEEMLVYGSGIRLDRYVTFFDGLLAVRADPEDHQQLESFLITLREAREGLANVDNAAN